MSDEHADGRMRRGAHREARLIRGATQGTQMSVVCIGCRVARIRCDAGDDAPETGSSSRPVERLAGEGHEQGGGGDRRDPRALRGPHRQAEAAFARPETALRTRRFSARPSGGSFASAVPSR